MTYDFRLTTAAGAVSHVSLPADVFREASFGLLWEMTTAVVVRVEIKCENGQFRDVPNPAAPVAA